MINKQNTFLLLLIVLIFAFIYEFTFFNEIVSASYQNELIGDNKSKVLCLILTSNNNIKKRAIPVYRTWAKKCDKALFAGDCSNFTNMMKSNDSLNFFDNERDHQYAFKLPILQLNVSEHYNKMAEKVMKVIKIAYDEYLDKFDWFLLVDDDTFIFVDHLYQFISIKSPEDPLTYGYNFKTIIPTGYHSGGGGTLITHESLKRMGFNIHKGGILGCNETNGYGDVALGRCAHLSNITLGNSLDKLGRERFHFNSFHSHYMGLQPDWAYQYSQNGIKNHSDCCSDQTISFHYTSVEEMEFFDNLKNQTFFKKIYS